MKKLILLFVFSISLFANTYGVNEKESSINFEATKFLFVGIEGSFSQFEGAILVNNGKIKSINGLVKAASIETGNEDRDADLKSNGYFDIKSYPTIKFNTVSIKEDMVKAIITIKGLSQELDFKISNINISDSKVSFTLESAVDREAFNLSGAKSAIINKIVEVKANIVANR